MSAEPKFDGGPAFPEAGLSGLPNGEFIHGHPGMSLRDYFAAKAMQGLIAACTDNGYVDEIVADQAYGLADCMLKARAA